MACWGVVIKRQSARKEKKKIFGDEGDLVMDGVLVVTDRMVTMIIMIQKSGKRKKKKEKIGDGWGAGGDR